MGGGHINKYTSFTIIGLSVILSVAGIVLVGINMDADTAEYQLYDFDSDVTTTTTTSAGKETTYVCLGDGEKHLETWNTNKSISNNTLWDTSKPLRLPGNVRVVQEGFSTISGSNVTSSMKVTVKLIAGADTAVGTIEADALTDSKTVQLQAGGLQGEVKLGKPSGGTYYDSINFYKATSSPSIDFLKVTDQTAFNSVMSPVKIEITVGEGESAVTSCIQVKFDDTGHVAPTEPSEGPLKYDSQVSNGFSVLDISVDSTYANTDNYLLTIAKYEGGTVYNSYLKVPSSESDKVRLAFSNDGLKQVIIEIVSSNDAIGESVPGYLAYCTYEPDQA